MKAVLASKRSPRKWGKTGRWSLCDDHGVIYAQISVSRGGFIHIDRLEGVTINIHEMNGMGQYQLDGEPEKPFRCPSCGDHPEKWEEGKMEPRANGYGFEKGAGQVVCKSCGASYFPEEAEAQ